MLYRSDVSAEKAASKSASLRPDQEAKVKRLLAENKMKRSHYYQMLVDLDLADTPSGTTYSRAVELRRSPISADRLDRLEDVLNRLMARLGESPLGEGKPPDRQR